MKSYAYGLFISLPNSLSNDHVFLLSIFNVFIIYQRMEKKVRCANPIFLPNFRKFVWLLEIYVGGQVVGAAQWWK